MVNIKLNNPLLRRYWFRTKEHDGFGVTAFSLDDAENFINEAANRFGWNYDLLEIIEDVDVRNLDQGHIIPNMGAVNFRGIWYPNLNT